MEVFLTVVGVLSWLALTVDHDIEHLGARDFFNLLLMVAFIRVLVWSIVLIAVYLAVLLSHFLLHKLHLLVAHQLRVFCEEIVLLDLVLAGGSHLSVIPLHKVRLGGHFLTSSLLR